MSIRGTRASAADHPDPETEERNYTQVDVTDRALLDADEIPETLDIAVLSEGIRHE